MYRALVIALALVLGAASAFASDLGDKDYTGGDAGYLVMAIARGKENAPDAREVTFQFRKLDRSDSGRVSSRSVGVYVFEPTFDFDDSAERGKIAVRALPPGDYEFFRFVMVSGTGQVEFFPYLSVPFTIRAGETTYLGDFRLQTLPPNAVAARSLGPVFQVLINAAFFNAEQHYFAVTDKKARDLAIAAKAKQPPKGTVTTAIPDGVQLHTPFVRSESYRPEPISDESVSAMTKGREALSEGHFGEAVRSFTASLETKKLSPFLEAIAYRDRGLAYAFQDQLDNAIADFERSLAINGYDYSVYADRGISYRLKGSLDLALADQTKAIDSDPDGELFRDTKANNGIRVPPATEYRRARADTYVAMRQYDLAVADMTESIRMAPQQADGYAGRARIYDLTGQSAAAIRDYSTAVARLNGKVDFAIYRGRAEVYFSVAQYPRAIADYTKIIETAHAAAEDYSARCYAMVVSRDDERGMPDCNRAVRMSPDSPGALSTRGLAHLRLRQYPAAIGDYDSALGIDPRFAPALFGRGVAKVKSGDANGGDKDVEDAKKIDADIESKLAKMGIKL